MKISSEVFGNNQFIPSLYTCDGENINPPLSFKDVPDQSKSLVLIVDDPDAPMGTFVHWLLWNIDPKKKKIAQNSFPKEAVSGQNDTGGLGYTGPCPPSGVHHYRFRLYALDIKLDLPEGANKQQLLQVISGHIVAEAQLTSRYQR